MKKLWTGFQVFIGYLIIVLIFLLLAAQIGEQADAVDLQKFFQDEAVRLNGFKIKYSEVLTSGDAITAEQAHDRVYYLGYYAEKLNYMCHDVHPRRVWKDAFAIASIESWFVNWQATDGGRGFGWISMLKSTAKLTAATYGWDWDREQHLLPGSDELQAKYMIGYYYLKLKDFHGDRHLAIISYNRGNAKDEMRWENYFFLVFGRLKYYEDIWASMTTSKIETTPVKIDDTGAETSPTLPAGYIPAWWPILALFVGVFIGLCVTFGDRDLAVHNLFKAADKAYYELKDWEDKHGIPYGSRVRHELRKQINNMRRLM